MVCKLNILITPSRQLCDHSKQQYQYNNSNLYINEYIAPNQIIKVLRHELAHAVFKSYNIQLEPKIKEEVADFIATYNDVITEKLNEILKEEGIV